MQEEPLSRRRILDAAVVLVDEQGLRALTMRGLGASLGVDPMALYRHVPGREDLLDGIVETVVEDMLDLPDGGRRTRPEHWRDDVRHLAYGVRRVALAHPEVFPLVATRPPAAPWVRPPVRSLRLVEHFFCIVIEAGHTATSAVVAYRAFAGFLLGHLSPEVSALGVDVGPVELPDPRDGASSDLSEYPYLQSVESELLQQHSDDEFSESLESLLDRMADMVPA